MKTIVVGANIERERARGVQRTEHVRVYMSA